MAQSSAARKPAPVAAPAIAQNLQAKGSGRTVTVACRIPSGLRLQLVKRTDFVEDTPQGPMRRHRFDRTGEAVVVRGPAEPVGTAPKGYARPNVVAGYALTKIDREFWDKWVEQNANNPVVTSKMIFAYAQTDDTKAEARELKDHRSGLEPLVVDGNDPRIPKPTDPNVGKIEKAEID